MENQFIRHEPCFERILFVLTLDRKKMKERILIGEEQQIRFRLNGSQNAEVLCDMTRPLGTFLINFERDTDRDWNLYGLSPLRQALHSNRWKQPELEQAASEFLWGKYLSNDPLKMYVAFRIWNSYLLAREPRDRNAACDRFMDKMSRLTGVFQNETMSFDRETGKPKQFQAGSLYFKGAPSEDTRLDLWFPDNRRTEECVSAYASLYPLITYYLNRLNDWGLCFRRCKVCGKYFLAKSQRYELCSDKCRKAQALQNKREFDERSRENNYDLLYKNECQNWRNKINRVKNTAGFPADRLEKIQAAFADFKKEALQRKKDVKTGPQHCIALTSMGNVYAWGNNGVGQLGIGNKDNKSTAVKVNLSDVKYVNAGFYQSYAIKSDGTVWGWGSGANHQLGTVSVGTCRVPTQITSLNGLNIEKIVGSDGFTIAVDKYGRMYSFGSNAVGGLGVYSQTPEIVAEDYYAEDLRELNKYMKDIPQNLTENIQLPVMMQNGMQVSWTSSNAYYLSEQGIVRRPNSYAKDEAVTLTALVSCGEKQILHFRCPSSWYLPSSGKNSTVPT